MDPVLVNSIFFGKTLAVGGSVLNDVTLSKTSVHRARSAKKIIMADAFSVCLIWPSTGPDILMFKR